MLLRNELFASFAVSASAIAVSSRLCWYLYAFVYMKHIMTSTAVTIRIGMKVFDESANAGFIEAG